MANIKFNGKYYQVDETSFSSASADLKSHLSTVMNGSGSVINFGGVEYNINSVKLSTAKNDFISHLGTISGSGIKIIVGGVEHFIDSTKVSDAVGELETVFDNLGNPVMGGNIIILDKAVLNSDILG